MFRKLLILNLTIKTQKVSYQLDQHMFETCVVRAISPKYRPGVIIRYSPVVRAIYIMYSPNHGTISWYCPVVEVIYVTGSAKTRLIAHDRKFDLSHKHKAWWMRYQISLPQTTTVKGSAFTSCFFQALWRALWAVSVWPWQSPGQRGDGCVWLYSSVVLDYDLCFRIPPLILASFEPWMACNLALAWYSQPGLKSIENGGKLSCWLLLYWRIWKVIHCCKTCEN